MYTNIGPWLISKQLVADWVADAPAPLEAIQKRALAEGLPYWLWKKDGSGLLDGTVSPVLEDVDREGTTRSAHPHALAASLATVAVVDQ